jgi:hypothetical protein
MATLPTLRAAAEYTRRTRLKTQLDQDVSAEFEAELRDLLGANYEHYSEAMHPTINRKLTRGAPPAESGDRKIQPQYQLRRADGPMGPDDEDPLASTTLSLSGHVSKSKVPGIMYGPFGPVPEYMFDDREKMTTLDSWFQQYGRPTPNAINLGPRQLYTHFEKSSKRCCGEPSNVTILKKGFVTA